MERQTIKAESRIPDLTACRMNAGCGVDHTRPGSSHSWERGVALLIALIIMMTLCGLALSVILLTDSQIRLGQTVQAQGQVFYASLAGIEEVRGRMNGSAPDTIAPALPTTVSQVLYIVNSSTSDPVQPTDALSPYYDSEYAGENPGGLASATVLPSINSDQPGVGTSTAIPYKWVRITLKTEASVHTDLNQDGVINSTSPVYWDGAQQTLSSAGGTLVYLLTALAVDQTRVRKMIQTEVAGVPGGANFVPLAAAATAGSISITGNVTSPNILVDGNDNNPGGTGCPAPAAALPGILAGGAVTISSANVIGNPPTQSAILPFPQSASTLISQLQSSSVAITSVDPSHITTNGTSYTASGATLGTQPSAGTPGIVQVVYADKPLTISGGANSGYGVLLVRGDLTVTGAFSYQGVVMASGQISFTAPASGNIFVAGSLLGSGTISFNAASGSSSSKITTQYNSCVVANVLQSVSSVGSSGLTSSTTPPAVLCYRELSF
jgi:hypothetical protein